MNKIKKLLTPENLKRENASIILIALVGLWVGYQTFFIVIKNNQLIAEISTTEEEVKLLELKKQNLGLSIEYYKTDEFVALSAKEDLLLREQGEHVVIAPKTKDAPFVVQNEENSSAAGEELSNFQAWLQFLSGKD